MEKLQPNYGDEIDLFDLIKIIWDGKLWVIMSAILTTSVGGIYATVVPKIYEVKVKVKINTIVDENREDAKLLEMLTSHSKFGWNISAKTTTMVLETQELQEVTVYYKDLENARSLVNSKLVTMKKNELQQISKLGPSLLNTEVVATTVLLNQRLLYQLETMGLEIVEFSRLETRIKSPKTGLVMVLAFLFGGMIGVFGILMQRAYQNREQNL